MLRGSKVDEAVHDHCFALYERRLSEIELAMYKWIGRGVTTPRITFAIGCYGDIEMSVDGISAAMFWAPRLETGTPVIGEGED